MFICLYNVYMFKYMFSSIWIDFPHEIARRYARHAVYRKSVVSVALFAR